MSKEIVDQIYITLLLAQKPYGDKQLYHKLLGELIKDLCQKGLAVVDDINIFEGAKKRYVSNLYMKAESLFNTMNFSKLKNENLISYLKSESDFLVLADYYRNAYYGLFYLCRALFVSLDNYDCSEHKDLWQKLKKLIEDTKKEIGLKESALEKLSDQAKKDQISESVKKEIDLLVKYQAIESYHLRLKDFREIGDYSMIEKSRSDLADPNNLEDAYESLKHALCEWSELK